MPYESICRPVDHSRERGEGGIEKCSERGRNLASPAENLHWREASIRENLVTKLP